MIFAFAETISPYFGWLGVVGIILMVGGVAYDTYLRRREMNSDDNTTADAGQDTPVSCMKQQLEAIGVTDGPLYDAVLHIADAYQQNPRGEYNPVYTETQIALELAARNGITIDDEMQDAYRDSNRLPHSFLNVKLHTTPALA